MRLENTKWTRQHLIKRSTQRKQKLNWPTNYRYFEHFSSWHWVCCSLHCFLAVMKPIWGCAFIACSCLMTTLQVFYKLVIIKSFCAQVWCKLFKRLQISSCIKSDFHRWNFVFVNPTRLMQLDDKLASSRQNPHLASRLWHICLCTPFLLLGIFKSFGSREFEVKNPLT